MDKDLKKIIVPDHKFDMSEIMVIAFMPPYSQLIKMS